MQARHGRVLVSCPQIAEQIEEESYNVENAMAGGRKITTGTVILVSPEAKDEGLKKKQTVWFPRYAANEMKYKGKLVFSVHEKDIEFVE
jgi:co-chaperonin GroES (HSP10)